MKIQYGLLNVVGTTWAFTFHANGKVLNQPMPNGLSTLDILDQLGSNGWELCDKNNFVPPITSPDEWVFLRRL